MPTLSLLFALIAIVLSAEPASTREDFDRDGLHFTLPLHAPSFTLNASLYHRFSGDGTDSLFWLVVSTPYDAEWKLTKNGFETGRPFKLEHEEEEINLLDTSSLRSGQYEFMLTVRKPNKLHYTVFTLVILDTEIPPVPCVCNFNLECGHSSSPIVDQIMRK